MTNEIITLETRTELETQNKTVLERVKAMEIKTEQTNTEATGLLKILKDARLKAETIFKPAETSAKKAYDEVRALRDLFLVPLKDGETTIRQKIGEFVRAENDRRAELQRKADQKFEKAAAKAEATGKPMTAAPQVVAKVSAPAGTTYVTRWHAEVRDIKPLCRAVADGIVPENYVSGNMPILNALAIDQKEKKEIAPGVMAVPEVSVSQRA